MAYKAEVTISTRKIGDNYYVLAYLGDKEIKRKEITELKYLELLNKAETESE